MRFPSNIELKASKSESRTCSKALSITILVTVKMSDISMEFHATSRNSASCRISVDGREIYKKSATYAHSNARLIRDISTEIEEKLENNGVIIESANKNELLNLIRECFIKCDTTYGCNIEDELDAKLTIRSAKNGEHISFGNEDLVCSNCKQDLTQPHSIIRTYVFKNDECEDIEREDAEYESEYEYKDKDEDEDCESVESEGMRLEDGTFEPHSSMPLIGNYDCLDDSDRCAHCEAKV